MKRRQTSKRGGTRFSSDRDSEFSLFTSRRSSSRRSSRRTPNEKAGYIGPAALLYIAKTLLYKVWLIVVNAMHDMAMIRKKRYGKLTTNLAENVREQYKDFLESNLRKYDRAVGSQPTAFSIIDQCFREVDRKFVDMIRLIHDINEGDNSIGLLERNLKTLSDIIKKYRGLMSKDRATRKKIGAKITSGHVIYGGSN
jgi:hypothetical protein